MAGHDRTKWDYFLNMQWSEFNNYSLLYNEKQKDVVSKLNRCKTFEAYMMTAISELI